MPPPPPRVHTRPPVKAEEGGARDPFVTIKVRNNHPAEDVFFRIKRDVRLRRLIDMYCAKRSLDPRDVVFLSPYGRHIRPAQTPDDIGLEDGDVIDAFDVQGGGGRASA